MRALRLVGEGIRRLIAVVLLCAFAPIGLFLLFLPLSVILFLPDLVLLSLSLVGVGRDGLFLTSGPLGVAIGVAAAYWHKPLGRVYEKFSVAPVDFVTDRLNDIIRGHRS